MKKEKRNYRSWSGNQRERDHHFGLHQVPVDFQTINLVDKIGQLLDEVGFEADVVLEDDAG